MNNFQNLDTSNQTSITKYVGYLYSIDESSVNEESLIPNIVKVLKALNALKENEYKEEKTYLLHRIIQNSVFYCSTEKCFKKIIEANYHSIHYKMLCYYINEKELNINHIESILTATASLTYKSEQIAIENINHNFHTKAIELMNRCDFLQDDRLQDDLNFKLYDSIVRTIYHTSIHIQTKEALIGVSIDKIFLDHIKVLNEKMVSQAALKFVKLNEIGTVANLLNDTELDTLPITNEIVDEIIDILNESIESSKTNREIVQQSKFYTTYRVLNVRIYIYLTKTLRQIYKISINDTVKEKLVKSNIFVLLQTILKEGNDTEIQISSEIICSLCFNDGAVQYLRENSQLMELINTIAGKTENAATKRSCEQIIQMVKKVLQQRVSSAKSGKLDITAQDHIMISYNHKYKEDCMKINKELKKRGYKTWMDAESTFVDLHDAMAKAIESSSIVLICYSYEYKISSNCRLEAQYALKLNKKIIAVKMQSKYDPDGWLGLGIASKLYIDYTKATVDSKSVYNNLCKQIDLLLSKKTENPETAMPALSASLRSESTQSVAAPVTPVKETETKELARPPSRNVSSASKTTTRNISSASRDPNKTENWNEEQVKNWMKSKNLINMADVLENFNGLALKSFFDIKQSDHIYLCNLVDEEIKKSKIDVKLTEKMQFFQQLDRLFNKGSS